MLPIIKKRNSYELRFLVYYLNIILQSLQR